MKYGARYNHSYYWTLIWEVIYAISNGVISSDLEWPITRVSGSQYFVIANISIQCICPIADSFTSNVPLTRVSSVIAELLVIFLNASYIYVWRWMFCPFRTKTRTTFRQRCWRSWTACKSKYRAGVKQTQNPSINKWVSASANCFYCTQCAR